MYLNLLIDETLNEFLLDKSKDGSKADASQVQKVEG